MKQLARMGKILAWSAPWLAPAEAGCLPPAAVLAAVEGKGSGKPAQGSGDPSPVLVSWPLLSVRHPDTPGLEVGGTFTVGRCLPLGKLETVAQGVVTQISGTAVEGLATPRTPTSAYNLYPGPMAGDGVYATVPVLRAATRISPQFSFDATQIFGRAEGGDTTLDVTEQGRALLEAAGTKLQGRGILVEAFVAGSGPQHRVRLGAEMRAASVAQTLRSLGSGDEVRAFGYALPPRGVPDPGASVVRLRALP